MNRRSFLHGTALASGAFTLRSRRVLGANDRVRLGIIGAGARGQELIKAFTRAPGAELVAVADAFRSRHEEARALAPNARSFDDHRKLLELEDLDAVIVATPLHCHARHFIDPTEDKRAAGARREMQGGLGAAMVPSRTWPSTPWPCRLEPRPAACAKRS